MTTESRPSHFSPLSAFHDSRIRTKLMTLGGLFVTAFLVFAALSWNTIDIVKVNGPYYKNIVQSKDLIADILPPPEYLIEAYLVTLQMSYETDKQSLDAMIEKGKVLRSDFKARRDFWKMDLSEGRIKQVLLNEAYENGIAMLDARDKEFIPLILKGDRAGALKVVQGPIKENYERHRAAIDEIVTMANEKYKADEMDAEKVIHRRSWMLSGFGLGILVLISAIFAFILRQITGSLTAISKGLETASQKLTGVSHAMSANAEETSSQATMVSTSSHQVNMSVQTVATGTEEMTAAIREISRSTADSVRVAESAVRKAEQTNANVAKLSLSSEEIGNILKLITSIAEQTNLLALNAAIEAARAGEAGKGFAVVANEVKELARETAKATDEISRKIAAIQVDTKGAIGAITEVGNIIRQINDIQNTVASAVEEQTVTTNEIAKNISEAARGTSEISSNITGVASAAQSTATGANDTRKAAEELSRMLLQLQSVIG
jgi:methyl-accepting chemotaxis protein